jgi:MFS family permease
LVLPVQNLFTINFPIIGTIVITLPLLVLFFARLIDGITGGNISVANAYLADISSDQNRSKNFGKMAISSNLGFIIGPALAGILGGTIYQEILPVLTALFLSLLTLSVIALGLKESKPKPQLTVIGKIPEKPSIRKVFAQECKECYQPANPKKLRFQDVFKLKNILFLIVLYFFIFLGFNVFYTSFPIHAVNNLSWSITELGIFYAVLSGIMVLVQGPILNKSLQKFSEEKLVIIGSVILGTNFILFVSNNDIFGLWSCNSICSWKWIDVAIFHVNTFKEGRVCISRSYSRSC